MKDSSVAVPPTAATSRRALLRVLGVAFGWAVTLGSMIGAGILRAPGEVAQATTSLVVFYSLWLALLVIAAVVWIDGITSALVAVGAPLIGVAGLWIREHWRAAWLDARRWFLLRGRRSVLRDLGRRQWEIAERFDALLRSTTRSSPPDPVLH